MMPHTAATIDSSVQELSDYFVDIINSDNADKPALLGKLFDDYANYLKANVDARSGQPPNSPTDKPKAPLSEVLLEAVNNMLVHNPNLNPVHAARWLMTTDQGQAFLAQHKAKRNIPMSVDIMKLHNPDSVIEFIKSSGASEHVISEVIMGHAKLTKRSGESDAQAFARVFPKFQTAYGVAKGYSNASMTPTSTEVGNTNVADDSAEAVRLLTAMAEQTGTSFEVVFAAPENRALAARTYRAEQLPTTSSTSGSELQRSRP